jgi:hypothetical protein
MMGLSAEDITEIDALLAAPGVAAQTVATLRERFPRLSVTRVDASDLSLETPFRHYERFDLYLVDGSNHCWSLTDSAERATGLAIAAHPGSS